MDVIELLNEPAAYLSASFPATVRQFWQDGYTTVRQAAGNNVQIMIEDAFLGVQSWQGFLTYPSAQGVLMDTVSGTSLKVKISMNFRTTY